MRSPALEFDTTAVGKPFLSRPVTRSSIQSVPFRPPWLDRCGQDRSVGVDIEVRRPISDLLGVALQIATPREAKLLKQLPTSQVHSAFFELWTRKEAVLKALGRGFFIDPRELRGWNWTWSQLRQFRRADLDGGIPGHQLKRGSSSGDRGRT